MAITTLIPQKIIDLFQLRIQNEEQSSRIYKAMSVWLNLNGYLGASKLWQKYSNEELPHAQWSYDYLLSLNIKPITPSQEEPRNEFKGLPQIIALSYQHEIKIKDECVNLQKVCLQEGDMLSFGIAQKYVQEQIEEIEKLQLWIDKLEAFGTSDIALRMLDKEMSKNC